jgi:hypothetical protein
MNTKEKIRLIEHLISNLPEAIHPVCDIKYLSEELNSLKNRKEKKD